jgi:hypothetical protein
METLVEIEMAIERLPEPQVQELLRWLELRRRNGRGVDVEAWLKGARGAAKPGITTDSILVMTRGED